MSVPSDVSAFTRQQLEELASRPNTTVYETTYSDVADAWPASRVEVVLQLLLGQSANPEAPQDDFRYRKACLDLPDVLEFKRRHPQLFWMATDREQIKDGKAQRVILGLLKLRRQVESGALEEGPSADAAATRWVLEATGTHL